MVPNPFYRKKEVSLSDSRFPDDPDGFTLLYLQDSGSDLSLPHTIQFLLFLPDETLAFATSRRIDAVFQLSVTANALDGGWTVLATRSMVPDYQVLHAIRVYFENLVGEAGGVYDGWVTQPVSGTPDASPA